MYFFGAARGAEAGLVVVVIRQNPVPEPVRTIPCAPSIGKRAHCGKMTVFANCSKAAAYSNLLFVVVTLLCILA
jgi:hypothetical protein